MAFPGFGLWAFAAFWFPATHVTDSRRGNRGPGEECVWKWRVEKTDREALPVTELGRKYIRRYVGGKGGFLRWDGIGFQFVPNTVILWLLAPWLPGWLVLSFP